MKEVKSKRKVTVRELLSRSDVNEVVDNVVNISPSISELVVIFYDHAGNLKWQCSNISYEHINWMLDMVKHDIFHPENVVTEESEEGIDG